MPVRIFVIVGKVNKESTKLVEAKNTDIKIYFVNTQMPTELVSMLSAKCFIVIDEYR
jgi:hypothetical protein